MSDINASQPQDSDVGATGVQTAVQAVNTLQPQPAQGQDLTQGTVSNAPEYTGSADNQDSSMQTGAPAPSASSAAVLGVGDLLQPGATDSEQLALLRKIDTDIGSLSTKMDETQRLAVRNGAIAGSVSGAVSGGLVALGLQFIRHKLGL